METVKPTNVFNRSMIGVVRVQLTHGKVVLSSGWCQIGLAVDIVDGTRINGGEQHGHSWVNDSRHTRDCLVIAEEGLHQQHREGGWMCRWHGENRQVCRWNGRVRWVHR